MTDNPSYEALMHLIDQVEIATPKQLGAFFTSNAWTHELKHHPDRFYRNDEGDLMWIGAKVVVVGDDQRFWSISDKIIPKEN